MANKFLAEYNEISFRHVFFEEDKYAAWLYLTEPNSKKIADACFIYNKQPPEENINETLKKRNEPIPLIKKFSNEKSLNVLNSKELKFIWANNGNAVLLKIENEPYAMIIINENSKVKYSIAVNDDCFWANKWDNELFEKIFCKKTLVNANFKNEDFKI